MEDAEFNAVVRTSLNARRKLAVSMLDAVAAGEIQQTAEEIADWKADLVQIEEELAELDNAQRP